MTLRNISLISFVAVFHVSIVTAQTLVGWRNDATGCYPDATPPTKWSATENVVWETQMPGRSYGSPIVLGDRIFVVSDPAELLCLRASDGEILWRKSNTAIDVLGESRANELLETWKEINVKKKQLRREYDELRKAKPDAKDEHEKFKEKLRAIDEKINAMKRESPVPANRGAGNSAGTPVCDGKYVYAAFGSGIVTAYDLDGERQWIKFIEGADIGFGHASSPVLVDGKLVVHYHDLVALDGSSGEIAWRTELRARHATPIAVSAGKTNLLISPSGGIVRASDGKVLSTENDLQVSEGSAIVSDGVIYAQSGKSSALALPSSVGDTIELELLWQSPSSRGRRTPSSVLHNGLLYGVTTDGILDVTDAKTGKAEYKKRLDFGRVYSSVTVAGDHLFISSTAGDTLVLAPGREYKEIARNKLESLGSNPVFHGKRMYIRSHKNLFCISE